MFVFRYIRTGCFTINGDPPSGTSFLVKLGHLKRLIYEKFERDELEINYEKKIFKGRLLSEDCLIGQLIGSLTQTIKQV